MKPFLPKQTGRTHLFWLLGTIVLFTFLALPLAFSDRLFQDRFEPVGLTPVHFATVELRDGDEQAKVSAETNELGQFSPFVTGPIDFGTSMCHAGALTVLTRPFGSRRISQASNTQNHVAR